jgi:hypothetical protein
MSDDLMKYVRKEDAVGFRSAVHDLLNSKVFDALELKKVEAATEYLDQDDLDERVRGSVKKTRRDAVDKEDGANTGEDGPRAEPSTGGKDRIGKGDTINQAGVPYGDEKSSRQKKKPLARPARYGRRDARRDSAGKDVEAERVSSGVTKADVPELKRKLRQRRMKQNKNPDKGSVWNK